MDSCAFELQSKSLMVADCLLSIYRCGMAEDEASKIFVFDAACFSPNPLYFSERIVPFCSI